MVKKIFDLRKIWTKRNDEFAARYFFRYISYPFSSILIKYTSIHPNTITLVGFCCGVISIVLYLMGTLENIFLATFFAFLCSVCDNIDGDVARVKELKSKLGMWLDGISGEIIIPLIIFSIGFGLQNRLAMVISALAMLSFPIHHAIIYFFKFYFSNENEDNALVPIKKTLLSEIIQKLRTIYGAAFFFITLTLFMIFQKPFEFLVFQAIIGNLFWIFIIFLEYKKICSLKS